MDVINDDLLPQASVVGAMLIDERCIGPVLGLLQPDDFLHDAYRAIFLTIRQQFSAGETVDPVTVVNALKGNDAADWYALVMQCMNTTPTAANAEQYAGILRETARLHRMRELSAQLMAARDMEAARLCIDKLNALQVDRPGVKITTMEQGIADFFERLEKKAEYLPWGFSELDGRLNVGKGKFVIIGGHASHGKTALALSMAYTMAEKYRVGFFSLETDDGTLMDRLIARVAQVAMPRIKGRVLTEEDYSSVAYHSSQMVGHKLELVLAAGMTVSDIFATAQSRRYDVIYVDYIQLIRGDKSRVRYEEITGISIDLHTKAQTTGITVVGLSQLSRQEKGGKTRRAPRMSDLRESGQLEQDADVIMLVYRENEDDAGSRRVLAIEKNKEGGVGQLYLTFDGETQSFRRSVYQAPPPKKKEPEARQVEFSQLEGRDADAPF